MARDRLMKPPRFALGKLHGNIRKAQQ